MAKALVIGGATVDILVELGPNADFVPGLKRDVRDIVLRVGGGATNVAVNLAKLGLDVKIRCAIGRDPERALVLDHLGNHSIDISCVTTIEDSPTGRAVILIGVDGEVTVLAQRGANKHLDVSAEILHTTYDLLYITAVPLSVISTISQHLVSDQAQPAKVAYNPGLPQIESRSVDVAAVARRADLVILSLAEATALARSLSGNDRIPTSLEGLATMLLASGLRAMAITDGSDGALIASQEHRHFQPAVAAIPRSTLGAGDAFGATLARYLMSSIPMQRAAYLAAANAAAAVEELDATGGTCTHAQLERLIAVPSRPK